MPPSQAAGTPSPQRWLPPGAHYLAVQPHLHGADLACGLIDAEEPGRALLQDGVSQGCIVCVWVVSVCGFCLQHIGAYDQKYTKGVES